MSQVTRYIYERIEDNPPHPWPHERFPWLTIQQSIEMLRNARAEAIISYHEKRQGRPND